MGGIMNTVGKLTRKLGDPLGVWKKPEMQSTPVADTAAAPAPAATGPTESPVESVAGNIAKSKRAGKKAVTVSRTAGGGVGLNV